MVKVDVRSNASSGEALSHTWPFLPFVDRGIVEIARVEVRLEFEIWLLAGWGTDVAAKGSVGLADCRALDGCCYSSSLHAGSGCFEIPRR